jgi:hypothetical protein
VATRYHCAENAITFKGIQGIQGIQRDKQNRARRMRGSGKSAAGVLWSLRDLRVRV